MRKPQEIIDEMDGLEREKNRLDVQITEIDWKLDSLSEELLDAQFAEQKVQHADQ